MLKMKAKTTILVADDEPSMLALVAGYLRSQGYKVMEASDGDQAWELACEHLPDLVVLDVMMPGMSGWEVCHKIRETVSLAHTGVVMLTGIGERLNEITSPLYAADSYLDKPFEFSELEDKIEHTLLLRGRAALDSGVKGGPRKTKGTNGQTDDVVVTSAKLPASSAVKARGRKRTASSSKTAARATKRSAKSSKAVPRRVTKAKVTKASKPRASAKAKGRAAKSKKKVGASQSKVATAKATTAKATTARKTKKKASRAAPRKARAKKA